MNLAQGLLNRARISGDEPALTDATASVSFSKLADRVTRIAGNLRGPLA